jgi:hypothetical protein
MEGESGREVRPKPVPGKARMLAAADAAGYPHLSPTYSNRIALMKSLALAVVSALTLGATGIRAADWPQFRGPNATGRCPDATPLPVDIGPDTGVVWKVPLPPGHSSPAVVGDRIYVTAVKDKAHLVTIALDRSMGKVL